MNNLITIKKSRKIKNIINKIIQRKNSIWKKQKKNLLLMKMNYLFS